MEINLILLIVTVACCGAGFLLFLWCLYNACTIPEQEYEQIRRVILTTPIPWIATLTGSQIYQSMILDDPIITV